MKDENKNKSQLIKEITELKRKVLKLEQSKFEHQLSDAAMSRDLVWINNIIETSNEGFWLVDNDIITMDVNPQMCSILDLTRDEIIGKSVFEFVDEQNRKIIAKQIKIRNRGEKSVYEVELSRKDGTTVPCIFNAAPLIDENGIKIGSFSMVTEISDRKKSENDLRKSEERYRLLVQNSPIGILFINKLGQILDVNKTLIDILGSPSVEATQAINMFTFKPLKESGISKLLIKCFDTGKVISDEKEYTSKWGKKLFLRFNLNPVRNEDGDIEGVLANVIDITEYKKAEEDLKKAHNIYREAIINAQGVPYRQNYNEGIYEFFGEGFENLLGIPTEELTFEKLGEITNEIVNTDPDAPSDPVEYGEAFRKGIINRFRLDLRITTPNGVEKWISDCSVPLRDEKTNMVIGSLGIMQDITERKRIETALRDSEVRYRTLFDSANDSIFLMQGVHFVEVNSKSLEMFRCTDKQILNKTLYDFSPVKQPDGRISKDKIIQKVKDTFKGEPHFFEWQFCRYDSTFFEAEVSLNRVEVSGRSHIIVVIRDITMRKRLEKQVQQSQKMEAVGRLAGGVAHDFNNLLTVIRGHCDLVLTQTDPEDSVAKRVKQIDKAGERAESLTRQLLAFSRRQILVPKTLNINDLLQEIIKMLRRLISENIELVTILNQNIGTIKADPSQIEQVIMNLVVNARDAMPEGGKLTIETQNVKLDKKYCEQHPGLAPGSFVMLAISDTGIGMDKETQAHIFEPFFTTKKVGEGTGLGLATVYGIIKQSKGFIWAYGEPGKGSTFKVFLPCVKESVVIVDEVKVAESNLEGTETILVVEDEEDVRKLICEMLQIIGYKVLQAPNGHEAMQIFNQYKNSINIILTDVVMPQMGGRDLVDNIVKIRPDMKVLFMSGYTETSIVNEGVLDEGTEFIQKPFTPLALKQKLRSVLS